MAETKLRKALRFISIAVTAATFAALSLFNHEWVIAPALQNCGLVYELSEFTLLASIAGMSTFVGVITEGAGMLLGSRIAERAEAKKAQAEAEKAQAQAEVGRERASREAAEKRVEELEAQLSNGSKPRATENGSNGNGSNEAVFSEMFKFLAAERDKDREERDKDREERDKDREERDKDRELLRAALIRLAKEDAGASD